MNKQLTKRERKFLRQRGKIANLCKCCGMRRATEGSLCDQCLKVLSQPSDER